MISKTDYREMHLKGVLRLFPHWLVPWHEGNFFVTEETLFMKQVSGAYSYVLVNLNLPFRLDFTTYVIPDGCLSLILLMVLE